MQRNKNPFKTVTTLPPQTASIHIPTPKTNSNNVEEKLYTKLFPHGSKLTEVVQHIFDDNGNKLSIDDLLKGSMKDIWSNALKREFGRLSNGIPKELLGTNTIGFVLKSSIPKGRKIT